MFLKFLQNSKEKICVGLSSLTKYQVKGLQLYWKRRWHRCFPVNFGKSFFRIPPDCRFWFKGALLGLTQFLATESPLKMMKNAFYFILKAFFVLRYSKFCLNFLVMQKNGLIKTIRLILKFMTSQPWKQSIAIHTFPISQKVKAIRQWN